MKNEFVPYDIALAMKELGFDENIELVLISYYYRNGELISTTTPDSFFFEKDEMIKAPLYQQAFRWFREKLKESAIEPYDMVKNYSYNMKVSWEEAQDACLRKLIEIVKEKL